MLTLKTSGGICPRKDCDDDYVMVTYSHCIQLVVSRDCYSVTAFHIHGKYLCLLI